MTDRELYALIVAAGMHALVLSYLVVRVLNLRDVVRGQRLLVEHLARRVDACRADVEYLQQQEDSK